jgi:hypothetical protein
LGRPVLLSREFADFVESDRLAKCDSEQARAEQHKAGCGYCE